MWGRGLRGGSRSQESPDCVWRAVVLAEWLDRLAAINMSGLISGVTADAERVAARRRRRSGLGRRGDEDLCH